MKLASKIWSVTVLALGVSTMSGCVGYPYSGGNPYGYHGYGYRPSNSPYYGYGGYGYSGYGYSGHHHHHHEDDDDD